MSVTHPLVVPEPVAPAVATPLNVAQAQARPLGVAVVGAGYWGPNLVRNFAASSATELRWVCDASPDRAAVAVQHRTGVKITDSLDEVLDDPAVEAVALATPAGTHSELALACLNASLHVLIEKPLACSVAEGEVLVRTAERLGLVLMLDHTYCYTPAVQRLREMVRGGMLGEIQYLDSVRINLGLIQNDIDVFWDLAPHDLAILDFVLPENAQPVAVAAHGTDPVGAGRACLGYLTLPLRNGGIAHINVNWLSPTKIRTTVIGGSTGVAVWDDLQPSQRLKIYDRGVELMGGADLRTRLGVNYRVGDMMSPALPEKEALSGVVNEFCAAIRERRAPVTDGRSGLRVLRILEAASISLVSAGTLVALESAGTDRVA